MAAEYENIAVPGKRLGKLQPRRDPRTLQLANYLDVSALPPAPKTCDWTKAAPNYPMFKNDTYGDCAEAAVAHQTELWSANANKEISITDQDVVDLYSAVTGFDPNDPSTDQGTVWIDLLNYWKNTGFKGHKIAGYVQVNHQNLNELRQATYLFGGVQLGIALPVTAQAQTGPGKIWSVRTLKGDGAPGSWGGHAVPCAKFETSHMYVITWGAVQEATQWFMYDYCDEAYAILDSNWVNQVSQKAPNGFNFAQLQADLSQLH